MEQVNLDRFRAAATAVMALAMFVVGYMLPDGPIRFIIDLPDTIALKWVAYGWGGLGIVLSIIGFLIAGYERE